MRAWNSTHTDSAPAVTEIAALARIVLRETPQISRRRAVQGAYAFLAAKEQEAKR